MPKAWLEDTRKAWEREAKARGRFAYSDGPLTVSATVRVGVEWWELNTVNHYMLWCCRTPNPTCCGAADRFVSCCVHCAPIYGQTEA